MVVKREEGRHGEKRRRRLRSSVVVGFTWLDGCASRMGSQLRCCRFSWSLSPLGKSDEVAHSVFDSCRP